MFLRASDYKRYFIILDDHTAIGALQNTVSRYQNGLHTTFITAYAKKKLANGNTRTLMEHTVIMISRIDSLIKIFVILFNHCF